MAAAALDGAEINGVATPARQYVRGEIDDARSEATGRGGEVRQRRRFDHEVALDVHRLGEIEGIDLTLTYLRAKRDEAQRLTRRPLLQLGLPRARGDSG